MNTTRKYPRTLQEAFGPYTSREIHEPLSDVLAVCIPLAVALAGWLLSVLFG
jgi:hypothetical protein